MADKRRRSIADTPQRVGVSNDPVAMLLVPLGELDIFSVQHFTQSAVVHLVEHHGPVAFDLTSVPFCDSFIYSLLDWVASLPDELAATVVTGPAIERVLGLLTER